MRLIETEIDMLEHMAHSHDKTELVAKAQADIVWGAEVLTIVFGTDEAMAFLGQVRNAFTILTEHGDLMNAAYEGFTEIKELTL